MFFILQYKIITGHFKLLLQLHLAIVENQIDNLESIDAHCRGLSKDELLGIILGFAQEVSAKNRAGFLAKIGRYAQNNISVVTDEGILNELEALKVDIRDRIALIENGSFYDDDYDGWNYDDEAEGLRA